MIASSNNVRVPQNDEFLAMRMYDSNDIRVPITKTALKERGLEGLEIPIEDSYTMKDSSCGAFDERLGRIMFNSNYQKKYSIIDTGYHESEHAYQYALLGITNRLNTPFGDKCKAKFKGTITPKIDHEAAVYEQGHKNYVQPEVNYDDYRNNILEKYAWDAGESGARYYLEKGRELSNQFQGIPAKEL